jgi:hypothetical protein
VFVAVAADETRNCGYKKMLRHSVVAIPTLNVIDGAVFFMVVSPLQKTFFDFAGLSSTEGNC